ncbi:hypothetical protein JOF56_002680 [Kibdelosporangium banguiense]|uniref:DUF2505 domain-containing protein n=1 Tax=Kibdelosporangium banguiense TaxID=1365924 RepID=A0ABS4TDZ8_9PSEU|nr:DUF2505 domain-containing protein [Kibdelosporangium banguiense]MBP2322295.1 hypothetical protein [Kibdelosporangium banguiense]
MPSRMEHRARFATPADAVYAAIVDPAFLTDRLEALGGTNAAVEDRTESAGTVTYRLRQGLAAEHLPSAVRTLLKGDLVVHRTETWRPDQTGTVKASVHGVPGEINGTMRLSDMDAADGGSEWVTSLEVKVSIPLVGGKIEKSIGEQVVKLLANEATFTEKWLAHRG